MRASGLFVVGPAGVTWQAVVGGARTDPFALFVDAALVVLAASYVVGLRRQGTRSRGSQGATASFGTGLLCLYVALGSGLAVAPHDPSADVGQHVLLMMVAPPLLVLGRPALAVRTPLVWWRSWRTWRSQRGSGARRPEHAGSGAVRVATGVASWPLYYGSMAAYFLTSGYADSLLHPALLDATQVGFVAVGLLFWAGLVGAGREGAPRSTGFRLAAVIAGMPVETAAGLALVLWPHPLAPGDTLGATHEAGLLLWLASMFTSGVALAVLLVQWCIADSRRAEMHEALVLPATPTRSDGGVGRLRP